MRDVDLTDEALGAYVDGELDAAEASQLEARLERDAGARARLESLQRVSALVRDAVTAGMQEPHAGAEIDDPRLAAWPQRGAGWAAAGAARPERTRRLAPSRVAAAFAAGVVSAALGLWLVGPPTPASTTWEDHALLFHQTYLEALRANRQLPLDARGSDPASVGASLSRLVDWSFAVPDLSAQGYTLQGARLIATAEGPLTYVLYSSDDQPLLGLAMLQARLPASHRGVMHRRGRLSLWEWSDGEHSFALGGTHSDASLRALADAVANAVPRSGAKPNRI